MGLGTNTLDVAVRKMGLRVGALVVCGNSGGQGGKVKDQTWQSNCLHDPPANTSLESMVNSFNNLDEN